MKWTPNNNNNIRSSSALGKEALQWRHNKKTAECCAHGKREDGGRLFEFFNIFRARYLANEDELSHQTSYLNYSQWGLSYEDYLFFAWSSPLNDDACEGVLPLTDDVMLQLRQKHPEAQEAKIGTLLHGPV